MGVELSPTLGTDNLHVVGVVACELPHEVQGVLFGILRIGVDIGVARSAGVDVLRTLALRGVDGFHVVPPLAREVEHLGIVHIVVAQEELCGRGGCVGDGTLCGGHLVGGVGIVGHGGSLGGEEAVLRVGHQVGANAQGNGQRCGGRHIGRDGNLAGVLTHDVVAVELVHGEELPVVATAGAALQ